MRGNIIIAFGLNFVLSLPTNALPTRGLLEAIGKGNTTMQTNPNVNEDMRAIHADVVGFTVNLKSKVFDLPVGSTVLFDQVLYNAGSGYDTSTGVFTCPRSGLYLFYVNVEPVNKIPAAAVAIEINGGPRVYAVAERFDTGHDSTGGNMLVQHIQEGDRVWVETYYQDNQDLYPGFTSFSGILIQST